jgi:hypothetical protein
MPYSISPDHGSLVLDPEVGASGSSMIKPAGYRRGTEHADRAAERAGARDLDDMVEAATGYTRARRDRERAYPRPATEEVPARRHRPLPYPDAIRTPLSARQRNTRSRTKTEVQNTLPRIGYRAMHELISDPERWEDTGQALTEARGDAQQLELDVRARVQRVDRAIRTAEAASDRDHVLYSAVRLPPGAGPAGGSGVPKDLQAGAVIEFDRFTMTTHAIHELDPHLQSHDVVFEISTARGMYLGRSDKIDDTTHLLPRGMRLQVASAGSGRYRRPDGSIGRRTIIQLVDITDTAT